MVRSDQEEEAEDVDTKEGTTRRMSRRSSQTEMPPPPLPVNRQHRRTRSNVNEKESTNNLRLGKRLNHMIQEEEEGLSMFTSPVAHRTRGQRPPSNTDQSSSSNSAPRTIIANAYGSPARPLRAAKQKAVARIKGKARAEAEDDEEDEDEAEEMELENDGEGDILVLSSDSEGRRGENGRKENGSRRSSKRTVKQVETPPSDADEESGGEEEEVELEMKSNLRAAGRAGGRHGKVVKLSSGSKSKRAGEEEDEEPELGEEDDEDQDMEADYEEEEEQGERTSSRLDPLLLFPHETDSPSRLSDRRR